MTTLEIKKYIIIHYNGGYEFIREITTCIEE